MTNLTGTPTSLGEANEEEHELKKIKAERHICKINLASLTLIGKTNKTSSVEATEAKILNLSKIIAENEISEVTSEIQLLEEEMKVLDEKIKEGTSLTTDEKLRYDYFRATTQLLLIEESLFEKGRKGSKVRRQIMRKRKIRKILWTLLRTNIQDWTNGAKYEKKLAAPSNDICCIIKEFTCFKENQNPKEYFEEQSLFPEKYKTDFGKRLFKFRENLKIHLDSILNKERLADLDKAFDKMTNDTWTEEKDSSLPTAISSSGLKDDENFKNASSKHESIESEIQKKLKEGHPVFSGEIIKLNFYEKEKNNAKAAYYKKHKYEKLKNDFDTKWKGYDITSAAGPTKELQKYFGNMIGYNLAKGKFIFDGFETKDFLSAGLEIAGPFLNLLPGGALINSFVKGLVGGWLEKPSNKKSPTDEIVNKITARIKELATKMEEHFTELENELKSANRETSLQDKIRNINILLKITIKEVIKKRENYSTIGSNDLGEAEKYFEQIKVEMTWLLNFVYGIPISSEANNSTIEKFIGIETVTSNVLAYQGISDESTHSLMYFIKKSFNESNKPEKLYKLVNKVESFNDTLKAYVELLWTTYLELKDFFAVASSADKSKEKEYRNYVIAAMDLEQELRQDGFNFLERINGAFDKTLSRLIGEKNGSILPTLYLSGKKRQLFYLLPKHANETSDEMFISTNSTQDYFEYKGREVGANEVKMLKKKKWRTRGELGHIKNALSLEVNTIGHFQIKDEEMYSKGRNIFSLENTDKGTRIYSVEPTDAKITSFSFWLTNDDSYLNICLSDDKDKVFDVFHSEKTDATNIIIYDKNGNDNQSFKVIPFSAPQSAYKYDYRTKVKPYAYFLPGDEIKPKLIYYSRDAFLRMSFLSTGQIALIDKNRGTKLHIPESPTKANKAIFDVDGNLKLLKIDEKGESTIIWSTNTGIPNSSDPKKSINLDNVCLRLGYEKGNSLLAITDFRNRYLWQSELTNDFKDNKYALLATLKFPKEPNVVKEKIFYLDADVGGTQEGFPKNTLYFFEEAHLRGNQQFSFEAIDENKNCYRVKCHTGTSEQFASYKENQSKYILCLDKDDKSDKSQWFYIRRKRKITTEIEIYPWVTLDKNVILFNKSIKATYSHWNDIGNAAILNMKDYNTFDKNGFILNGPYKQYDPETEETRPYYYYGESILPFFELKKLNA